MKVSIVIPVYNEVNNIGSLVQSIYDTCRIMDHEIIVINDGSTDGTLKEVESRQTLVPSLKILSLKRNFGQTAAMAAGFDHAHGDVIIPLDGDGQNDPNDIPLLLSEMEKGYDVISGWRKRRNDPFISRRVPSFLANFLISWVTGVHLHDYGCTLKAYRRNVIDNLQISGEMHRFLPAWCVWQGGKVSEIVVRHHPRKHGKSKYGLMRIFKVIIDLMTLKFFSGYLSKPNYLFSGSGFVLAAMSFLSAGFAIYDKFGPDQFQKLRFPLLLLAVFLGLVAVLLILIGLLAELLVRLYFQVRHQKPYRLANE